MFVVCEDVGDDFAFDPVTGFRLSGTPFRMAQISLGELEFVSQVRGNARGLPDRDDFGPRRARPDERRVAVFGDSYTAGFNMQTPWPDRVEDLLAARGDAAPPAVLNVSLTGWGVANWWSVITRELAPQDYDLDAVVFAVWGDDLDRCFHFAHARDGRVLRARFPSWNTEHYPRSLEEALPFLRPTPMYLLARDDFEAALAGGWMPPRRWSPVLAPRLLQWAGWNAPPEPRQDGRGPRRSRHLFEIARFVRERGLPALVVMVPSRYELLSTGPDERSEARRRDARAFAESLRARFLDGMSAFAGLEKPELRAFYPPRDLHWNQRGADRFAAWLAPAIDALVP